MWFPKMDFVVPLHQLNSNRDTNLAYRHKKCDVIITFIFLFIIKETNKQQPVFASLITNSELENLDQVAVTFRPIAYFCIITDQPIN